MNIPSHITIEVLNIYPIKSCHGISLKSSLLSETGLQWDRNWVVCHPDGLFLSQREKGAEKLATVVPSFDFEKGILKVNSEGFSPLIIPLEKKGSDNEITVKIHDFEVGGVDEGDETAKWFSALLDRPLRLVRVNPKKGHINDPEYVGHENAISAGQDGFQYLIASNESLDALNERRMAKGEEAVPLSRFRANIEISGVEPFGEDAIKELHSEDEEVVFRLVKPCARCKIIDIDQEEGVLKSDVLSHLSAFRVMTSKSGKRKVMFAQNAVAEKGVGQVLKVGDRLRVFG